MGRNPHPFLFGAILLDVNISFHPSPNFTPCYTPRQIDLIVVHLMAGTLIGTRAWFANPKSLVSAHYGIGKDGTVDQYVTDDNIAWHAGIPAPFIWANNKKNRHPGTNPNAYSIGIENEGQLGDKWPDTQIKTLAQLIAAKCHLYKLPIDDEHVVGHHEVFAGHNCPGPYCPLPQIIELAASL